MVSFLTVTMVGLPWLRIAFAWSMRILLLEALTSIIGVLVLGVYLFVLGVGLLVGPIIERLATRSKNF